MTPDGELLRNQPWPNAQAARGPYGHFYSPQDGFYAASSGSPPPQYPAFYGSGFERGPTPHEGSFIYADGVFGPQLGAYAAPQPSPYLMEGSAPLWGAYPDFLCAPGGGHQWQYQPASPWGWFRPHLELDRLDGGHNPALGWNPTHLWNTQPDQQQQQQQQTPRRYQEEISLRGPTPLGHHRKRQGLLRSPTPESTTSNPSRLSTSKPIERQNGTSSSFREILRSAGKLSRALLSSPRRTASRLSRSASRARNRSTDDEDEGPGEEKQGEGDAYWSEDGVKSPPPEPPGDAGRKMQARGSVSRAWGSLRRMSRHSVGDGRGESHSPMARGKREAAPGTWQKDYQRASTHDRQAGGEKRRPRPQSYPCFSDRRTHSRPGDGGPGKDHGQEESARRGGSNGLALEDDRSISRMNGLLDIWDAQDNPSWEEEAFALCDLSRCRRCGRFYAPMRTVPHRCRREAVT